MDYYAILGVHPTAEDIVIRAAYKALAQRYHPDRFTGSKDEAHRRMSDLTKAYEVLADPVRRQKYDRRRLTYTQSVATYFNTSPRFAPPALDPRDLRLVAAKRKRSRIALSALMLAVMVLSAFNLVQYSPRLKDWLSASTPAPASSVDAVARRATGASVTGRVDIPSGDLPENTATAKPHDLPVAQGAAPADAAIAEAEPPPRRPDSIASRDPATTGPGELPPRQPAAAVHRAAAANAPDSSRSAAAAPPGAEPRAAAVSVGAIIVQSERPITVPPPAPTMDACGDAVVALGLCSPNTTARNK